MANVFNDVMRRKIERRHENTLKEIRKYAAILGIKEDSQVNDELVLQNAKVSIDLMLIPTHIQQSNRNIDMNI